MPRSSTPAPDDVRSSRAAAVASLGGHLVILLVLWMLAGHLPETLVAPSAVTVTLVNSQQAGQTASTPNPSARLADMFAASSVADTPSPTTAAPRESLDSLFGPARGASTASAASPSTPRPSGSSRVHQGLGPGEGAEGIDLYAAASLPNVGVRPSAPLAGDLWERVEPCWRPVAPRTATLLVEIRADGALAAAPQAIRRRAVPVDPQTLLAERAATRALQACAPYAGLGGRQWRIVFPEAPLQADHQAMPGYQLVFIGTLTNHLVNRTVIAQEALLALARQVLRGDMTASAQATEEAYGFTRRMEKPRCPLGGWSRDEVVRADLEDGRTSVQASQRALLLTRQNR